MEPDDISNDTEDRGPISRGGIQIRDVHLGASRHKGSGCSLIISRNGIANESEALGVRGELIVRFPDPGTSGKQDSGDDSCWNY